MAMNFNYTTSVEERLIACRNTWATAQSLAADREKWRDFLAACKTPQSVLGGDWLVNHGSGSRMDG